jgi:hypothetical protein
MTTTVFQLPPDNLDTEAGKATWWDKLSDEDKIKAKTQAIEILLTKANATENSLERVKLRMEAMRNTAIQCKRKADLLQGQANSLQNTVRNTENLVRENEARVKVMKKAALILQYAEINTP